MGESLNRGVVALEGEGDALLHIRMIPWPSWCLEPDLDKKVSSAVERYNLEVDVLLFQSGSRPLSCPEATLQKRRVVRSNGKSAECLRKLRDLVLIEPCTALPSVGARRGADKQFAGAVGITSEA